MSLAKKVTLMVTLLAAGLLLGTAYTVREQRHADVVRRVRAEARLLASVIRQSVEASMSDYGRMGAIEDLVSRLRPVKVTFYGLDARAIAPVPEEEEPAVNPRARRAIKRNEAQEEVESNSYAYRVPLHDQQSRAVAGVLELRFDLELYAGPDWDATALLVAAGLLLGIALTVGTYLRKTIQEPINKLMVGMDHVIRGDLTHALPLDRNDEIGRIAYRFNEMTAQLRDAQKEIRGTADARLRLQQRLRQSEKLATVGQLSAEIAHEVGTPLNVIGLRARSLLKKADKPEVVTKNSAIIADQAERITKIIQQMLDLSRARIIKRAAVDLVSIVGDAVALLEYQMERAGVTVNQEQPDGDLPAVRGDADGLQQVFINLVHNAVQAMPEGGELTVRVGVEHRRKGGLEMAPPEEYVVVSVADTGAGIPEKVREQIFEPFFSTKGQGEGTGLGLTVVQGIVKEHDGWIEVADAEPRGAELRVFLPTGGGDELELTES